MSSSSESEVFEGDEELSANDQFVEVICKYPIIFNKSQVPQVKKEKEKVYLEIIKEYGKVFGKDISVKQLQKKLHNMKGDVKKKVDKNATGNKTIILKEWEKKLVTLLEGDKNPTFVKIPGALTAGTSTGTTTQTSASSSINTALVAKKSSVTTENSGKKQKLQLEPFETEETKNLGNAELQRLVLLEQLQLIRMQKEKESLILQKLQQQKELECNVFEEGGNTYLNL